MDAKARERGAATRRAAGDLESEVLAALWAAERPLTPSETSSAVRGDLAYTTVQTTLIRLLAKGAVRREQTGRAFAYAPLQEEAAILAGRMRAMLDSGNDRAAVLTRFIGDLDADDEKMLAKLFRRRRTEGAHGA